MKRIWIRIKENDGYISVKEKCTKSKKDVKNITRWVIRT